MEVVGGGDPQAVDGVGQVGVGVDAPGHDPVAARVQDLAPGGQVLSDIRNPPVADQDVGRLHAVGRYHGAAGDQQFAHGRSHVLMTPGPARFLVCASPGAGECLLR